jgi:hypothetical protein
MKLERKQSSDGITRRSERVCVWEWAAISDPHESAVIWTDARAFQQQKDGAKEGSTSAMLVILDSKK